MSGTIRGWAVRRLIAACALFAGLFLMHGMTAGGDGCHGEATPMSEMSLGAAMHHLGMPAVTESGTTASGHGQAQSCVSTPPRLLGLGLLLLALAALAALVELGRRRSRAGGPRHGGRAPPLAGTALLIRMCVSRT